MTAIDGGGSSTAPPGPGPARRERRQPRPGPARDAGQAARRSPRAGRGSSPRTRDRRCRVRRRTPAACRRAPSPRGRDRAGRGRARGRAPTPPPIVDRQTSSAPRGVRRRPRSSWRRLAPPCSGAPVAPQLVLEPGPGPPSPGATPSSAQQPLRLAALRRQLDARRDGRRRPVPRAAAPVRVGCFPSRHVAMRPRLKQRSSPHAGRRARPHLRTLAPRSADHPPIARNLPSRAGRHAPAAAPEPPPRSPPRRHAGGREPVSGRPDNRPRRDCSPRPEERRAARCRLRFRSRGLAYGLRTAGAAAIALWLAWGLGSSTRSGRA